MSDTRNDSRRKRSIRTIGINFPHSEEGNRIYNLIDELKEEEDRSYSKVVFRILLEHFKGTKPANTKSANTSVRKKQINLITGEVTEIPDTDTESNDKSNIHEDDPFTTST